MIIKHTTVNYSKGNSGRKYIVIHYTGNKTDTAKANANYFYNVNRGASAHYFVDETDIYEVVSPDDTAWSVGVNYGKNNLFGKCTNRNSISIEMCSTNGKIADKTFKNTVELTKSLMKKYNIPASNVVRHYDVCSKLCPAWTGWIPSNETIWYKFKSLLTNSSSTSENTVSGQNTKSQTHVKEWQKAMNKGFDTTELDEDGIWGNQCESFAKTHILKYNIKGCPTAVKWLQKKLGITADGIFGNQTKSAVINFQKNHGLDTDGIVGLNSYKALLNV